MEKALLYQRFALKVSDDLDAVGDVVASERPYVLADVMRAAKPFQRRLTFEYVLIAGRNDRDPDADRLAKLARELEAHVNLLPLHPGGAPDLAPTPPDRIRAFAGRLRQQGVEAVVRRSRGLDINAACGQLYVEMEQRRRAAAARARPVS